MASDLSEIVDGRLRLNFHKGQWKAWQSQKRFVCVLAGTQSGKTSWGPFWLWREIQTKGPGDYMVVTPTFTLLELKALPEFKRLFEDVFQLGKYTGSPSRKFVFSDAGSQRMFGDRYSPTKKTQIFFGYAEDPDSLESATAKAAWLDEAGQRKFKLGAWEAILRRLSIAQGRALITTTPYDLGWLKQKIWDGWKKGDDDIEVIRFDSTENPAFPQAEFERAKRDLPAWKFDLFYRAIFTRPAGLIYDSFNEAQHKCPRFKIPNDWPRFLGLDFGGVNTAGLFYAQDPKSNPEKYYLYREYKAGGRSAVEHVRYLLQGEPSIPFAVGGSKSEDQWRREFAQGGVVGRQQVPGLPIRGPEFSDVEVGIDRVYGAHARGQIVVFDDLSGYLEEKQTYARALDKNGEPTEKIEDKETFHFCLAAGTLVTTSTGALPIEQVQAGMQVLTRNGFHFVTDAWLTGIRPVRRVRFSDGTVLTGTVNHPVWVKGKGFVPIGELCYNYTVLHQREYEWKQPLANSTELFITATQNQSGGQIVSILSDKENVCIVPFGSFTTGQSLKGRKSITRTKTRSITILRILNLSSQAQNIFGNITRKSHRKELSSLINTAAQKQQTGISRERGVNGTQSISIESALSESRAASNAYVATQNMKRDNSEGKAVSAPTLASQSTEEELARTMSRQGVSNARSNLAIPDTVSGNTAQARVIGFQNLKPEPVYNLTVEDAHEYFANGILVSNCDAERYIISHLMRKDTFIQRDEFR